MSDSSEVYFNLSSYLFNRAYSKFRARGWGVFLCLLLKPIVLIFNLMVLKVNNDIKYL